MSEKPCFPNYSELSRRKESFNNFPKTLVKHWARLAEAGFFYKGKADTVICFFCNGALSNWKYNDDPWVEHESWFPDCLFVKTKDPLFMVELVQRYPPQAQINERSNSSGGISPFEYQYHPTLTDPHRAPNGQFLTPQPNTPPQLTQTATDPHRGPYGHLLTSQPNTPQQLTQTATDPHRCPYGQLFTSQPNTPQQLTQTATDPHRGTYGQLFTSQPNTPTQRTQTTNVLHRAPNRQSVTPHFHTFTQSTIAPSDLPQYQRCQQDAKSGQTYALLVPSDTEMIDRRLYLPNSNDVHRVVTSSTGKIDRSLYLPNCYDLMAQTARPYGNVDTPSCLHDDTSQSDENPVSNDISTELLNVEPMPRPQPEGVVSSNDKHESPAVLSVRSMGYSSQAIQCVMKYLRNINVQVTACSIMEELLRNEERGDSNIHCIFCSGNCPADNRTAMSEMSPPIICKRCLKKNAPEKKDIARIKKELRHPNACVTDESMQIILELFSRRFQKYYIPSDLSKFFIENGVQPLDILSEFAQVIFVPPKSSAKSSENDKSIQERGIGHVLLLTNIGDRKICQLIDSLPQRSSIMDKSVQEILKQLLGSEEARNVVEKKRVSVQIGNIECGLFVIASLTDICLGNGNRLDSVVFDQQRLRPHLIETIKNLFENKPIQTFPAIRRQE